MNANLMLRVGGVLLILLGFARGAGGALLLAEGRNADLSVSASPRAVVGVGLGLLVVGMLAVASGVGVVRKRPSGWRLGLLTLGLFVLGGVINGTVLYGHPGTGGTAANLGVAGLVVALLMLGREALSTHRPQ